MTAGRGLARLPRGWPHWPVPDAFGAVVEMLPGDRPPGLAADGGYVLWHGTSAGRAADILDGGFEGDGIGRIGFGTVPGAVRLFARRSADADGDDPCLLRCVVRAAWVRANLVVREGNHANLWLFGHPDDLRLTRLGPDDLAAVDAFDLDGRPAHPARPPRP